MKNCDRSKQKTLTQICGNAKELRKLTKPDADLFPLWLEHEAANPLKYTGKAVHHLSSIRRYINDKTFSIFINASIQTDVTVTAVRAQVQVHADHTH